MIIFYLNFHWDLFFKGMSITLLQGLSPAVQAVFV